MSNHTPGPWHTATADEWRTASGEHAQWGRFDISAGSNDQAAENYYRVASVSNVNNSDQNQANAKLIGAAPDLLEALRAITDDRGTWNLMPMQLRDLAGAALAKATGCAA
jgi:hypothetical protein